MSHLLSFVVKSTRVPGLYPGASLGGGGCNFWCSMGGATLFGAPHTPGFCTWVQLLGGSTFNQSAEGVSTLLYPVSLLFGCWDRVQGGDPLYGPVKCILGHRGQIWPIWTRFFAKRPYQYGFGEWLFSAGLTFTFLGAKIGYFWGVWPNVRMEEKCQNGGEERKS